MSIDPADSPAFVPGLTHRAVWDVRPDMSPPHLPVHVLSTPWMLGLIEQTCHDAVRPHIGTNRTLVGTAVTLTHSAPAKEGAQVEVTVTVLSVGRRMSFDAHVQLVGAPDVTVGAATMEMAVVDVRRFGR